MKVTYADYTHLGGGKQVFVSERKNSCYWFNPSESWGQAGPIIEREKIGLEWDEVWIAHHPSYRPRSRRWTQDPSPLVAAMRCYVAAKLGDEVELPDELINCNTQP